MKIDINEYFKMVTADDGKLLSQKDGEEVHIMKMVYVPLAMSDDEINSRYIQIDENDFEISINTENQTYSKLAIRRACRTLGLQEKLNAILNADAVFAADWADAQEIDLNDEMFIKAVEAGVFSTVEINQVKEYLQ